MEHSDTPGRTKWWILTHKITQTQLYKTLKTTVKDIMLKIHPTPTHYDVQLGEAERQEANPLHPQFIILLEQLTGQALEIGILQPHQRIEPVL